MTTQQQTDISQYFGIDSNGRVITVCKSYGQCPDHCRARIAAENQKYDEIHQIIKDTRTGNDYEIDHDYNPNSDSDNYTITRKIDINTRNAMLEAKRIAILNKYMSLHNKFYFVVPFSEKNKIKELGGSWDATEKSWYVMKNNINLTKINEKWHLDTDILNQLEIKIRVPPKVYIRACNQDDAFLDD